MTEGVEGGGRVRLWDLPTRLFHWALVVLIGVAWWSGGEKMDIHRLAGYAIIGLVAFRLYWGFFGGSTARFAHFLKGPGATIAYAKTLGARKASETAGHNPVGGLSVVALLVVLAVQVTLGLFAVDVDGLESGPLSDLVDFDTGRAFAEAHELSFRVLQALVALHIAAVFYYLAFKRENLIRPMVTGWRAFTSSVEALRPAPLWRLALGIALAAALAWATAKGFRFH